MSRHKKTRQEKMRADSRRSSETPSYSLMSSSPVFSVSTLPQATDQKPKVAVLSYQNTYHDLTKTFLLTAIIVAAQLLLFYLLKNHLVTIPMITALY